MIVTGTSPAPLLGAYAMAPADPAEQREFYAALADLPIGGLELPLPDGDTHADLPGRGEGVPPWDLLVTCIPTVMGRLGVLTTYGLASDDDEGRSEALDDVRRAARMAVRLADTHGRRRVVAIQVHSAPGPGAGSGDALTRSLEEVLTWDLAGARLLVEHCDARVPGQTAAKGFLTLEQEIVAVRRAAGDPHGAGGSPAGLSINWGRSAIEGRSAGTPVAHVEAAAAAGLLGAVVLSGATDVDTAWGPAWADAHIPPRGQDPALAGSTGSLLDAAAAAATLRAAGPACPVAVKISVRPKDADVATRLAVARAALELVAAAR